MKPRNVVLALAALMPAALAIPAVSRAVTAAAPEMVASLAAPAPVTAAPLGTLVLASNDDQQNSGWIGSEHEDDYSSCGSGGDDDEDESGCVAPGSASAPAPAGTTAPPANGLFASGAPAVVQSN